MCKTDPSFNEKIIFSFFWVECMLKVSVICEADSLDIQEFIKDQQTFISVSMKSCIVCYG